LRKPTFTKISKIIFLFANFCRDQVKVTFAATKGGKKLQAAQTLSPRGPLKFFKGIVSASSNVLGRNNPFLKLKYLL
jgi:hypothetical protein